MKFVKNEVRLVCIKQFDSKNGNRLTFFNVADKQTFESCEFMAAKNFDLTSISEGQDYKLVVDVNGRYINASLLPLDKK